MCVKQKLLDKCVENQQNAVKYLQIEIDEARKQSNDYGQPKDRYDAFRTKLMRQIEMFGEQLKKANNVLTTLQRIPIDKICSEVEFGAVVITNKQKLFISAGIGKVEIDGTEYYAISPIVPIYKAIAGMKKGDSTSFNGVKLVIEDLF